MATISLCMIVKNEEAVLERCLSSIADLMDEIIIVDTGSTDRTKEIARRYTSQIYDFPWNNDFSAARNFSFSKATMEYIYTADADEVLDAENHFRFSSLKQVLLPEIEIVQMKYITGTEEFNTVMNIRDEYRPKLYKRLRQFCWVDPIHETVRTEPVVFDSDIEILHLPQSLHSKRDFEAFLQTFGAEQTLSQKLHQMYARELFISGTEEDFLRAEDVFTHTLIAEENASADKIQQALCVLCRCMRIKNQLPGFFKYALRGMAYAPCSEISCELGTYFYEQKDLAEAIRWYSCAATETESVLDVHTGGDFPLSRLAECYYLLADTDKEASPWALQKAAEYQKMAKSWQMPEEAKAL